MKKRFGLPRLSYVVSLLTLGLFGISSLGLSPAMADVMPLAVQENVAPVTASQPATEKPDSAASAQTIPSGAIAQEDSPLTPAEQSSQSDQPSSGNSQASANTTTSASVAMMPEIGIDRAEIHRIETAIRRLQNRNKELESEIAAIDVKLVKAEAELDALFDAQAEALNLISVASADVLRRLTELSESGGAFGTDEELKKLKETEQKAIADYEKAAKAASDKEDEVVALAEASVMKEMEVDHNESEIAIFEEQLWALLHPGQ